MSCCGQCLKIEIISNIPAFPDALKIGGRIFVDIPDGFTLESFKTLSGLSDVDEITDESFIETQIPATPANVLIAKSLYNHNLVSADRGPVDVLVTESGFQLYFTRLQFLSASDDGGQIGIKLIRGTEHWLTAAAATSLQDITDLGTYEFTVANVATTNSTNEQYADGGDGVYFPLVNYGAWIKNDGAYLEDLRPWFHILSILQKGFCYLNWLFRCPALETNEGRKIIAYLLDEKLGSDSLFEQKKFSATISPTQQFEGGQLYFDTEIFDNGNVFDTTTGIFTEPGLFNFTARLKGSVLSGQKMYIELYINRNGAGVASDSITTAAAFDLTIEREILVGPGEYLQIVVIARYADSDPANNDPRESETDIRSREELNIEIVSFYNDPIRNVFARGQTLTLNEIIGNYNFLDLFKGVLHLFNGKIKTDWVNRTIWVYPARAATFGASEVDGFFTNTVVETDVLPESEELFSETANLKRFVRLEFAASNDSYIDTLEFPDTEPFGSKTVDLGSELTPDTEPLRNPFFEPTANNFLTGLEFASPAISPLPIDAPQLLDNSDNELSFKVGPRIAYTVGEVTQTSDDGLTNRTWKYENATTQTVPYAFQIPKSFIDGTPAALPTFRLVYGDVTNDFYSMFWKSELLRAKFTARAGYAVLLNTPDYKGEDFRNLRRIYYRGRSFLARLLEVNNKKTCDSGPVQLIVAPEPYIGQTCDDAPIVDSCDNQPRINIAIDIAADTITATAEDSGINSAINTDVWRYSDDDGGIWNPYTVSVALNNKDKVIFERVVTFTDSCPTRTVYRTADVDALCKNAAFISLTYDEPTNTISAVAGTDDFVSSIDTETWYKNVDDAGEVSYTPGDEINSFTTVVFRRVVSFTGSCDNVEVSAAFDVDGLPCNNQPAIQFTTLADCIYTIQITGTVNSVISFTDIQLSFDDGATWRPYNGGPVRSMGNFKIRAAIYYADGCPPTVINSNCPGIA